MQRKSSKVAAKSGKSMEEYREGNCPKSPKLCYKGDDVEYLHCVLIKGYHNQFWEWH